MPSQSATDIVQNRLAQASFMQLDSQPSQCRTLLSKVVASMALKWPVLHVSVKYGITVAFADGNGSAAAAAVASAKNADGAWPTVGCPTTQPSKAPTVTATISSS